MPELPEVETVKNGLKPFIEKQIIKKVLVNIEKLRYPICNDFSKIVSMAEVTLIYRRAKYIIIKLNNGYSIISHLGMSGKYIIHKNIKINIDKSNYDFLKKHDHLVFFIQDENNKKLAMPITYNDPRRFGFIILIKNNDLNNEKHLKKLGLEPFDKKLTHKHLFLKLQKINTNIKQSLLNQSIIAGIGNIYASEILWDCKISPYMSSKNISIENCKKILKSTKKILSEAIQKGGSTLKDYSNVDGELGYFQHHFKVYGKTKCKCKRTKCEGNIKKISQSGRSTFYCNKCQNII